MSPGISMIGIDPISPETLRSRAEKVNLSLPEALFTDMD